MKLRNFLILFMLIALTGLQETYICKAMNPNNLSVFKKVPKSRYKVIEGKKAPKKNKSENKWEKYKINTVDTPTTVDPDYYKEIIPYKILIQCYDQRCRCQNCYWTGYPLIYRCERDGTVKCNYRCTGCDFFDNSNIGSLEHWSEDKIPGVELSLDFGKCSGKSDGPHSGFIYDSRLRGEHVVRRINWEELKKSNDKYWFYCYSCKEYFLVPMNAIQHPKSIFEH